jgi:transposase
MTNNYEDTSNESLSESAPRRRTYKKISDDDRQRIVRAIEHGASILSISTYENIPVTTIRTIYTKYLRTGNALASPKGGHRFEKVTNEIRAKIRDLVDKDCTLSLRQISNTIMIEYSITLSQTTIFNHLKSMHYTLKVLKSVPERRNDCNSISLRIDYARKFIDFEENYAPSKMIFLDEVGFSVSMRTKFGRAPIGITPTNNIPQLRTRNISVCCAMNRNGMLYKKVRISPYNELAFNEYLREFFSVLHSMNLENCIFFMDNVAFHRCVSIRNLVEEHGHQICYLPPYSPSLNPIESAFSKWKNYVKRANSLNETELFHAMEEGFNKITGEDCDGWYRLMKREIRNASDGSLL